MGETPENIWLTILNVLHALTLLQHAPHGKTCRSTCPGCRSNKFCSCRAAHRRRRAACCPAARCRCRAARRRALPSSCHLAVLPVAVVVPPFARMPLAVAVLPSVAIVLPPVTVVVPHVAVLPRHLQPPLPMICLIVVCIATESATVSSSSVVVSPVTTVVPRRRAASRHRRAACCPAAHCRHRVARRFRPRRHAAHRHRRAARRRCSAASLCRLSPSASPSLPGGGVPWFVDLFVISGDRWEAVLI
jgi:hypothetical protein